ncbi:MAG: hypothetical protein NBKEAIPA_02932 [Nitrospirae bacterium]|nr:MAG: hypothetical protein UZ03_NOB001002658 [Nitrospira sp. OLB3]MBV6471005.1 hypothetical protein [Nitrospirota bacterium]MCK6493131.1 VanZ family protein [Nitrospira sp.]MCK6501674.1 VanZ family protein [Nitrospira sp.]MEB2339874.1 VanZ family protein [Nitrospirales bacterium]
MVVVCIVILVYMVLLLGLAVASPGIGLTGALLALVPDDWRDWAHVPAYGILAWLVMQGFRLRGWPLPYALLSGLAVTVTFGLWTEVAQGSIPGREASLPDLAKDGAGALLAAVMIGCQTLIGRPAEIAGSQAIEELSQTRKGSRER